MIFFFDECEISSVQCKISHSVSSKEHETDTEIPTSVFCCLKHVSISLSRSLPLGVRFDVGGVCGGVACGVLPGVFCKARNVEGGGTFSRYSSRF